MRPNLFILSGISYAHQRDLILEFLQMKELQNYIYNQQIEGKNFGKNSYYRENIFEIFPIENCVIFRNSNRDF